MELDGSSSAEIVVNIGNMMAGFLNHFSKALNTAANYPASEIMTHHHRLKLKQVVDQEQKSLLPRAGDIYKIETATHVLRRFDSLNPPTFDGKAGPKAAEYWMNRMKEILEVILAPKNLCTDFARRMLTGRALVWFQLNKIYHLKDMSQFTRRFLKVYSPVAFKRACEGKVWCLQRDMSIEEYRKMYELDKINYTIDETDRMHFFYTGLKPLYRRIVGETMLNSYKELVEFTFILERLHNHIKEGKVVNLEDYFTRNKKINYYLECSLEVISAGCFFCGSVEHYRCSRRERIRGSKKVVAKIQKNLEFCFHCKSTGHYLRNCTYREKAVKKNHSDSFQNNNKFNSFLESAGDKGGESRSGCFRCGSREHKRHKCPLTKSKGQKQNAENLSDSLQHNKKKFRSVLESSEDKVGESKLVCFGSGSREHKRNKCSLTKSKGEKRNAENLNDSLQHSNKKFRSVPESSEDKVGESKLVCFGCGSREHKRNKCPLSKSKRQKRNAENLGDYLQDNKKFRSVPESSEDKVGESGLGCFGCGSREHRLNECPLMRNQGGKPRVKNLGESFQNNSNSNKSKTVPESSADSLQNKCSSVLESSGDTPGGSKAHCVVSGSKEHTKKNYPVLERKRRSRRENYLNRKRANESVVTDVKSPKANI